MKYDAKNVYVEKDEFKAQTWVVVEEVLISREFGSVSSFGLRANKSVNIASFSFKSSSASWRYLRCNDIAFLSDGERVDPISESHDGFTTENGVREWVSTAITAEQLQTLADGKDVKGRICSKEFEVTESHKSYISEFLRKWDPPEISQTGASQRSGESEGDAPSQKSDGPQCYKWQSDYEQCVKGYEE